MFSNFNQKSSLDLVVVPYDPEQTSHTKAMIKARALSHAARVSYRHKEKSYSAFTRSGKKRKPTRRTTKPTETEEIHIYTNPKTEQHDPLHSLPCEVDPAMQHVFAYWADPSNWGCLIKTRDPSVHSRMFRLTVQNTFRQLVNPTKAPTILFEHAALMAGLMPSSNMEVARLKYKQDTIRLLRNLVETDEPDRTASVDVVLSALECAIAVSDPVEVELHLEQLRFLLHALDEQDKTAKDAFLVLKLGKIYYYDWIFALKRGASPLLSERDLPAGLRSSLHQLAERHREALEETQSEIKMRESVNNEIAVVLHQWQRISRLAVASNASAPDPLKVLWLAISNGDFLRCAIQVSDDRSIRLQSSQNWELLADEMIIATLLLHTSMCWHMIKPLGQFSIDNGVADKLKHSLSLMRDIELPRSVTEMQLWSLYIAACWEISYLRSHTNQWEACFVQMLRRHAVRMRIRSWTEASDILAKILPVGNVHPEGSKWFDELMMDGELSLPVRGLRPGRCWKSDCSV